MDWHYFRVLCVITIHGIGSMLLLDFGIPILSCHVHTIFIHFFLVALVSVAAGGVIVCTFSMVWGFFFSHEGTHALQKRG